MRRLPSWAKVTVAVATISVLGVAALALSAAALFAGGFGHIFHQTPDPRGGDIAAARLAAAKASPAEMQRVTGTVLGPALARPQVVASGSKDHCTYGVHNYKRNDSYDLECSRDEDAIVAFDGATFRAQTLALHDALVAAGWVPTEMDTRRVVREYWDAFASTGNPPYTVDDLPAASYTQRGTGRLIELDWLDPSTTDFDVKLGNPWGDVAVSQAPVGTAAVRAALNRTRYAVKVRITTMYWQK